MARSTVAGSGALLGASTEDAGQLRRNVTSPKGTTERALALLAAQPEEADEVARPQQLHLERFASVAAALAKPRS
jgi:pyrroline-5-carboxylate reductase